MKCPLSWQLDLVRTYLWKDKFLPSQVVEKENPSSFHVHRSNWEISTLMISTGLYSHAQVWYTKNLPSLAMCNSLESFFFFAARIPNPLAHGHNKRSKASWDKSTFKHTNVQVTVPRLKLGAWDPWSNAPHLISRNSFVGPWSPFITGLFYDYLHPFHSRQFSCKNFGC